jgi:flagellar biosynthesis regulator FlaF
VKKQIASVSLSLVKGWNYVVIDLAELTRRLFGTEYRHAIRVRVFANTRVRRIFFHDVLLQEHELPVELRALPDVHIDTQSQPSPAGDVSLQ